MTVRVIKNVKITRYHGPSSYQMESWTLEIDNIEYMYYHYWGIGIKTTLTLASEFDMLHRPSEQILYDILLPLDLKDPAKTIEQFNKLMLLQ